MGSAGGYSSGVLAGHPKIGKAFLVLGIALAVADGREVLGLSVEKRPVLYLALEEQTASARITDHLSPRQGRFVLHRQPAASPAPTTDHRWPRPPRAVASPRRATPPDRSGV